MQTPSSDHDRHQIRMNGAQGYGNIEEDAVPILSTSNLPPEPQDIAAGRPEGSLVVSEVPPTDTDTIAAETITASEQGQPIDPSPEMPGVEVPSGNPVEENDDDSDDRSSVDDDHDMWVNLQEDSSGPSEEELREMKSGQVETSALDRE